MKKDLKKKRADELIVERRIYERAIQGLASRERNFDEVSCTPSMKNTRTEELSSTDLFGSNKNRSWKRKKKEVEKMGEEESLRRSNIENSEESKRCLYNF